MNKIFLDTETFSTIPISAGSYKYSESVEVMIITYALDDGPVQVVDLTSEHHIPDDLANAINDPSYIIVGHNFGGFDRVMLKAFLNIDIPPWRIHDTMARAYAHGLPGSLHTLCEIFNAPSHKAKDKVGKKLIQLFCQLRKDGSRATRETHPEEWQQFIDYAKLDIEATRYIFEKMPNWNYTNGEFDLWCLDQKINQRGYATDVELIDCALITLDEAQEKLRSQVSDATDGVVDSATRRDVMLKYITEAYGITLPDMQASTLERRIDDPDTPPGLRHLLQIRLMASTSSTAKYRRYRDFASSDGRVRGTIQFCGAARTGRSSGRGPQPHNQMRPTMKQDQIELGIETIKAGCADLFFRNVMELVANAIRGAIVAGEGKKLVAADLSNIEGRFAAWIAGEQWKLKAFEDFDNGIGPDLYALAYAKSFRVTPESVMEDKKSGGIQRTVGKTMELALGFGGGCNAFVTFALNFNIDLNVLVEESSSIPSGTREKAEEFWEYCVRENRTLGLDREVFITCDSLKRLWRLAHPAISSIWKEIEDATRNAIESKNKEYRVRDKLTFIRTGNWLKIILPSSRALTYAAPRVSNEGEISYMGMNTYSRKWERVKTYGPKTFENVVQGGARDVFMQGLKNAEGGGYPVVLHVHDEIISEVPDRSEYSVKELCRHMTTGINWIEGLPLAAAGFESHRYRKES